MPVMKPQYAGANIEYHGTYLKQGVAASLVGATMRAMLKTSPANDDLTVVASITTTLTANGQITLETGETGVANSGYFLKFLPPATAALVTSPPVEDLYIGMRIKEADNDEYEIIGKDPNDPVRVPIRMPVVRSVT